ncbi:MAG: segregation and condensation protein A [Phycisphaerales bacterium]
MPLDDVRIQLDAFEGPLDLLLYLIRRDELEITDIPIAQVTEQYLALIRAGGISKIDIEQAGEFLVMAATLMEIKSRLLMPASAAPANDNPGNAGTPEADPRADLIRQLLAYKKYREAAQALDRRADEWSRRYAGGGAAVADGTAPEAEESIELDDLDVVDLAKAFARIMEAIDLTRLGEHKVTDDETPTALHAEDIVDRLSREADGQGDLDFRRIFEGRSRAEAIGLFLAVLELIRQQRVQARQDRINDRIVLRLAPPAAPLAAG